MSYDVLGNAALDYLPCRYGTSRLLFRGPRRSLDGEFIAFLGGTETYGKFIPEPYPTLLEVRTGVTCVNFGWLNAGLDVYLHDPGILTAARQARAVVLQVTGAQNLSNRFYQVHPRRNDRFVRASAVMQALYPEVDFTDFHFTRHMLARLKSVSAERFEMVRQELKEAWVARMRLLAGKFDAPVLLLWFAPTRPGPGCGKGPCGRPGPMFVDNSMLEALRGHVQGQVIVPLSQAALDSGTEGMVYSDLDLPAAEGMLGPRAHAEAAAVLEAPLRALVQGARG